MVKFAKPRISRSVLSVVLVSAGAMLLLGLIGLVVVIWAFSPRSPENYGAGRFMRFKSLVGQSDRNELVSLLKNEQVTEFNERRRGKHLAGKYLVLSGLSLIGKELRNADLSKCVLDDCDFTAADLRGASFKDSYLAQTTFYRRYQLRDLPTSKAIRRTDLRGASFEDATLRAVVLGTVDFGYTKFEVVPLGVEYCKIDDSFRSTVGVRKNSLIELTEEGGMVVIDPQSKEVLDFQAARIICENPFQSIPESEWAAWRKIGVDVQSHASLRAYRIDGELVISRAKLANPDPNVIIVVTGTPAWITVLSNGPVIVLGETAPMHSIYSNSLLWFHGRTSVPNEYMGKPVITGPEVHGGLDRVILSPVVKEPGTENSRAWLKHKWEKGYWMDWR